jgi:hypothetical protein
MGTTGGDAASRAAASVIVTGAVDGPADGDRSGDSSRFGVPAQLKPHLPALRRGRLARSLRDVIVPILAVRLFLMLFAVVAVAVFAPQFLHRGLEMWNNWDSRNYLEVAQHSYGPPTNPNWIVLFPLFPLTIAIGSIFFDPFNAGMLITLVATLVAGLGLYELVRFDSSARTARLAVLAMVLFPTAYTLIAPYAEALFLATATWAFVAARRNHMATAGILGALAAATRIQGAFLILALGSEYLTVRRRIDRDVFWILFVGSGTLIYLGINWYYFGSPLQFMQVQQDYFHVHNQLPWVTFENLLDAVFTADRNEFWVSNDLAVLGSFLLLAIVTLWASLSRHSRPSYAIYTFVCLVSFATLSFPVSVPRYLMAVFPIFIAMGSWARHAAGQAILLGSSLLLGMFMTLFLMYHWAF